MASSRCVADLQASVVGQIAVALPDLRIVHSSHLERSHGERSRACLGPVGICRRLYMPEHLFRWHIDTCKCTEAL
jgi:hypothetical protein